MLLVGFNNEFEVVFGGVNKFEEDCLDVFVLVKYED